MSNKTSALERVHDTGLPDTVRMWIIAAFVALFIGLLFFLMVNHKSSRVNYPIFLATYIAITCLCGLAYYYL